MEFLRFDFTYIFFALVASSVFLWIFVSYFRWQISLLKYSHSFNFNFSLKNFKLRYWFFLLWFLFLILALFWPSWSIRSYYKWASSNVIFLIDVSKSMDAQDSFDWSAKISRLEKSKLLISHFISSHKENNYSLVCFAWDAVAISPLTNDIDQLLTYIAGINSSLIRIWWSDINKALDFSLNLLGKQKNWNIILLSNWFEDSSNSFSSSELQKKYSGVDFKVFSIWLWTSDWDYIPSWVNLFWNMTYKTYNSSKIITRLDAPWLKSISSAFKWKYLDWNKLSDIEYINSNLLSVTSGLKEIQRKTADIWYYFIFASFILISIGYILPIKRRLWKM
jgi:Ca-activated chloride channel family protein